MGIVKKSVSSFASSNPSPMSFPVANKTAPPCSFEKDLSLAISLARSLLFMEPYKTANCFISERPSKAFLNRYGAQ